jgi:anti-sigma regulatory factor (Ser/Thr protein kinase)
VTEAAKPGKPVPPLRLQVSSDPANLAPVRHAIEEFCAACGMSDAGRGDVALCVNEAMANVTRHAYGGAKDRPVVVEASLIGRDVVVTLRDWGNGTEPPLVHPHDPLKPGGLGLVCLRTLMDEVQFSPQPDGMLLTMKRKLP